MNKRVIITGSTGMVGSIVLELCLQSSEISEVVALVRRSTPQSHPKYKEVIVDDFLHYEPYIHLFKDVDIVFYCLGVYTGAVPADEFKIINVDYPLNLARSIHSQSPNATFCLLSGQGADNTEKSKMQFARDKGAIENALTALNFKSFYSFRPGYIYPTTKRKEPNLFYKISRLLYPVIKLLGSSMSITDQQLAATIFTVGMNGFLKSILENRDMKAFNQKR
jgi:nucleoside-diphosphate-sugar epimerase